MQVAPSGGQNWNQLHVGPIWNQFWWHHLVVKFWTNTSGTTYNWPNLEPKQVAFYSAGEITQVIDSLPWVRCASGNVYSIGSWIYAPRCMAGPRQALRHRAAVSCHLPIIIMPPKPSTGSPLLNRREGGVWWLSCANVVIGKEEICKCK